MNYEMRLSIQHSTFSIQHSAFRTPRPALVGEKSAFAWKFRALALHLYFVLFFLSPLSSLRGFPIMPFDQGSITFRICRLPESMPENTIERFAEFAAQPLANVTDEPCWGWVSPRHLLDDVIDETTIKVGAFYHLCLRQAERKIPASLLTAECRMIELARMAETGSEKLGNRARRSIKAEVQQRLLPQMPPQLSGIYFAIDTLENMLYTTAISPRQLEIFLAHFGKVIGFEPMPLTPENIAEELFELDPAAVPALNISPDPKRNLLEGAGTLGENFLTWLWFFQEERGGNLPPTKLGDFSLLIDGPLVFVAEGPGAFESAIRKGAPTLSAEAKASLTVGKKLKRAKLTLARGDEEWSFNFDANEFIFRSLKLPESEALDKASLFEDRMNNLIILQNVLFALFQRFLKEMTDSAKASDYQAKAREWIKNFNGL